MAQRQRLAMRMWYLKFHIIIRFELGESFLLQIKKKTPKSDFLFCTWDALNH